MASAFFLYGQFEEVLVYLNSIRSFFVNDDVFNYNYAQVCKLREIVIHISMISWVRKSFGGLTAWGKKVLLCLELCVLTIGENKFDSGFLVSSYFLNVAVFFSSTLTVLSA